MNDLALNNLQRLICHKKGLNNQYTHINIYLNMKFSIGLNLLSKLEGSKHTFIFQHYKWVLLNTIMLLLVVVVVVVVVVVSSSS